MRGLKQTEESILNQVEALKEKAGELSSRVMVLKEKLRGISDKQKSRKRFLDVLKAEIVAVEDRILKNRERLTEVTDEIAKVEELFEGVKEATAEIKEELKDLEVRRAKVSELLKDKNSLLKRKHRELSDLQRRLKDVEITVAQLDVKEEELLKRIVDMEATVSDALKLAESVADEQEVKRELINLKEKISRLGSVNLLAIEEYERIKERYSFIVEQEKDLVNSIKNLKQAVKRLDEEIERRFMETFKAVNRHFKKVFRRMFDGGKARLILTSENIAQAGVEIEAKPPGKRHSSINLLSGGERTLVAIALLYALHSVRPAPFVVLDEVDAALDESNTLRFVELLKQMAEETQVIVITHNKLTMESADVLYGVTMEVPGVSKIIGASFEALTPSYAP